jgi:nonspecific dipeptidase
MEDFVQSYFHYIDENASLYKERLAEAVAIPSVSANLDEHLDDILRMMEWTKAHIIRLKGRTNLMENPASTVDRPLPPILVGEFLSDPKKKTVCVYGHLDVQPAKLEDGWDSEPFVLEERDGKLYGRGSTDDKGPALSWLWVVEAHQKLNKELPVNLKLMYEGMEESGSDGIFEWIEREAQDFKFLSDVDFFCISDNYWLGKTKPCLTYGLRGMAYFQLAVQGCQQDLHSGVFGGSIHEAMTDLIKIMATLVDSDGTILIDGIMNGVKPVTTEEEAMYETIEFSLKEYKKEAKIVGKKLLHKNKKDLLMHRWRFPTLSLHGIEGAFSGSGAKTVIPAKVIGKFSLRLVPDQDPAVIEKLVKAHVEREFDKVRSRNRIIWLFLSRTLYVIISTYTTVSITSSDPLFAFLLHQLNSPNTMEITNLHGAKAWLSDPHHPNYQAATRAVERVFGQSPDMTREGGSIPITTALEEATGMSVLLLPVGACDDMAHSQNEKYNVVNMVNAVKVLGLYLHEIASIPGPKPSDCWCRPLTQEELMVPGAFMKGFKCKCVM